MKKIFFILFVSAFISADAFSQSNQSATETGNGSYYSYFGLGMPVNTAGAQENAMGILGVSYNDFDTPGLGNPAFWGVGSYTRGSSSVDLTQIIAKSPDARNKNNLFEFGTIHLVLPIVRQKLGISTALYPVTRSNYRATLEGATYPSSQDTLSYIANRNGNGGVSKFELGFGYSITKSISIGYAPSIAFLRKSDDETIQFLDSAFRSNTVSNDLNATAISHRFGLLIAKNSLFRKDDLLQFGSSVTLPLHFDAKNRTSTTKSISGTNKEIELDNKENLKVSLPLQISSGFTYFMGPLVNFSVEGMYEEWDDINFESNPNQKNNLKNRYMIGAGAQYHPYRTGSEAFFSRFMYSAGISYDEGHLNVLNNDINTLWFSTGLGIKSPRSARSSLDISLQYGLRGINADNAIKENVWTVGFTINLTEVMFYRQKLN